MDTHRVYEGMQRHFPAFLQKSQPTSKFGVLLLLCCALALMTGCKRSAATSESTSKPIAVAPGSAHDSPQTPSVATPADHTNAVPAPAYDIKRCNPKLIRSQAQKGELHIHIRKGDKPTGRTPAVHCEILESGEVANVVLNRSSGIRDKDDLALRWVKEMKYSARPGCGIVESDVAVTIDFF